jgi:hypothetical protein
MKNLTVDKNKVNSNECCERCELKYEDEEFGIKKSCIDKTCPCHTKENKEEWRDIYNEAIDGFTCIFCKENPANYWRYAKNGDLECICNECKTPTQEPMEWERELRKKFVTRCSDGDLLGGKNDDDGKEVKRLINFVKFQIKQAEERERARIIKLIKGKGLHLGYANNIITLINQNNEEKENL